jgi:CDP-glucose 4,6-dehydratase
MELRRAVGHLAGNGHIRTMSDRRGSRVLVTGCTGFVGAWLCDELLRQGAFVTGLVWPSASFAAYERLRLPQRIAEVRGDINDASLLRRALQKQRFDTVYHLAARAIVIEANEAPAETFEVNIRGTWTLLEAVRVVQPDAQVVVATSDKVYGDQASLPYRESSPLGASHPYDVSKACADILGASYANSFGLRVAVVRCGNIYGGGDLNGSRLIPGTIRSALAGERPLIRSDGTLTRDYIHIRDVLSAYLAVADALGEGRARGEAFNFGNRQPVTVLDVVDRILGNLDRLDLRPVIANQASGEIQHQWLDSTKAKQQLGWRPSVNMDDGLRETVAWYRDFAASEAGARWVGEGAVAPA